MNSSTQTLKWIVQEAFFLIGGILIVFFILMVLNIGVDAFQWLYEQMG